MPNPLRIPIVLLVVLAIMLMYVHAYHRHRVQQSSTSESGPLHDRLQLRGTQGASADGAAELTRRVTASQDGVAPGVTHDAAAQRRSPLPKMATPISPPESPDVSSMLVTDEDSVNPPAPAVLSPAPATTTLPTFAVTPSPNAITTSPTSVLELERAPQPVMHRIVDGDTLPDLAERYLGDRTRYLEILDANRDILIRPDLLPLGVRIRIP